MTEKENRGELDALNRTVQHLTEENEMLTEKAEDISLLGNISEKMAMESSIEGITALVIESIATLKDIFYCAFVTIRKNTITLVHTFCPDLPESLSGLSYPLSHELKESLEKNNTYFEIPPEKEMPAFIPQVIKKSRANAFYLSPITVRSKIFGYYLCVNNIGSSTYMKCLIPLMKRIADVSGARIETLVTLDKMVELNKSLESKITERTAMLRKVNEQLLRENSERGQTAETLRRRVREMEAMNKMSQTVSAHLSIDTIVTATLDELQSIFNPDLSLLFLRQGETLVLQGSSTSSPGIKYDRSITHRVGDCLCGAAAKGGISIYSEDIFSDPRCTMEECKAAGIHSFAALPLQSGNETIGVLAVASKAKKDFSDMSSFLETIAAEVALGLHNAQMYESLKVHSETLDRINADLSTEITARKIAVKALRESEGKLKAVIHALPDMMFLLSREGIHLDYYAPDRDLLYVQPETFMGKSIHETLPREAAEKYSHHIKEALDSKNMQAFEYQLTIPDEGIQEYEARMVVSGEDETLTIVRNITERKNLEHQLLHSQKMEAVGQLAGGVAHEFNNILTALINNTYLLRNMVKEDGNLVTAVDKIFNLSNNAAAITRELLTFSRKQHVQLKPLKLNALLKDTSALLSKLIREDVAFVIKAPHPNPVIMADKNQMEQVIMNLVTNARDAMPHGGSLTIESSIGQIDSTFIETHGFGEQGTYVLLKVKDTGCGMDRETSKKVFEPFFTTKEVGKGTGLGLAIVYGIVKEHKGYILVESIPGEGSIFTLYLPESIPMAEKQEDRASLNLEGKNEVILLAEDEPYVRESIRTILEEFNYAIIEAADGTEAINLFIRHRDEIQMVILDVIMPKMNGNETLKKIREIKPDMKAIFLSGYTSDVIEKEKSPARDFTFITKPVSPDNLLTTIQQTLKGA